MPCLLRSASADTAVQYDVVLVLRKPAALEEFMKPKVSLGVEFSVAAGPVGNGAMLEGGPNGAACWSYTKSKGEGPAHVVSHMR